MVLLFASFFAIPFFLLLLLLTGSRSWNSEEEMDWKYEKNHA